MRSRGSEGGRGRGGRGGSGRGHTIDGGGKDLWFVLPGDSATRRGGALGEEGRR